MLTKKCCRCQEVKEVSLFNKLKRNKDGLRNYCRECQKAENNKNNLEVNRKGGKHYETKAALSQNRRAQKLSAMPVWADKKAIKRVSNAVQTISRETGNSYHLGHIHPLKSELSCGLHIAANLMPELAEVNMAHGNSFHPYRIVDGQYYELHQESSTGQFIWVLLNFCSWNPSIGSYTYLLDKPYLL